MTFYKFSIDIAEICKYELKTFLEVKLILN